MVITDFQAGTVYRTHRVAAVFGVTTETIRNWMKKGIIKGSKIEEGSIALFDGAEVQRLYRDRIAQIPDAAPTQTCATKAMEAAAKRLAKRKGK
jgi:phage terminase Nu1 subunit (DNA packaging protein)